MEPVVGLGITDPAAYRGIVADTLLAEIEELGSNLRGLRVSHLSATPHGGGVAEILRSFVPLQRGAGLDVQWYVIEPDLQFFEVTKKIHNMLQGQVNELTPDERAIYLRHNELIARRAGAVGSDIWVVHDPQPLAVLSFESRLHPAIWRCHIDTSTPNESVRDFLLPFVREYDQLIFSLSDFTLDSFDSSKLNFITPTIDALIAKNAPLDRTYARRVVHKFGPEPDRPLVTQVSRFDPWKDPIGVVDAYRLAKREYPGLQLALLGSSARDDPEAVRVYADVEAHVGEDPDVYLLTERDNVGPFEVNTFQTASEVVVQKSTREGFGLTVAEAMWKGSPVVGGRAGGIQAQILDGHDGFLVSSVEECADRIVTLLADRALAREMGARAREHVRSSFLMPRLLVNYLRLLSRMGEAAGLVGPRPGISAQQAAPPEPTPRPAA